jgi:sugar-specific transcriptional regulator TrmB
MDKNDVTLEGLHALGLSRNESVIYIELLRRPATHAELALSTGINRTTIYRLVGQLEKRDLIRQEGEDKKLFAADPSTLETEVVSQEARAKEQRAALARLLPALEDMKKGYEAGFAVHHYEGVDGFKRMLWHELEAKNICLCISSGTLGDWVGDDAWAEKHRQMTVSAGYTIREIVNPETMAAKDFTANKQFQELYDRRLIPREVMPVNHLMAIYNDTVATYHIYENKRIGLEVVSKSYADTMRSMFELLWKQGQKG